VPPGKNAPACACAPLYHAIDFSAAHRRGSAVQRAVSSAIGVADSCEAFAGMDASASSPTAKVVASVAGAGSPKCPAFAKFIAPVDTTVLSARLRKYQRSLAGPRETFGFIQLRASLFTYGSAEFAATKRCECTLPATFPASQKRHLHVAVRARLGFGRIIKRAPPSPERRSLPVIVFIETAHPAVVIYGDIEMYFVARRTKFRRLRPHERFRKTRRCGSGFNSVRKSCSRRTSGFLLAARRCSAGYSSWKSP